jgi:hypothetical protein
MVSDLLLAIQEVDEVFVVCGTLQVVGLMPCNLLSILILTDDTLAQFAFECLWLKRCATHRSQKSSRNLTVWDSYISLRQIKSSMHPSNKLSVSRTCTLYLPTMTVAKFSSWKGVKNAASIAPSSRSSRMGKRLDSIAPNHVCTCPICNIVLCLEID